MERLLHFQFNEIGFNISAEKQVLEHLMKYWQLSLDVEYNYERSNDWFIRIVFKSIDRETTKIDYNNKTIIYTLPFQKSINRINSFIREFITKVSLSKGYIWLHASFFNIDDKGYIMLGSKGYGKSTHLLNAYYNYSAEIITNDQVPIKISDGKLVGYRWRPDVKFSPNTLKIVNNVDISKYKNIDRFLWMPNKEQYSVIDFLDLSKQRNQSIKPFMLEPMRISKQKEFVISKIIFLDDVSIPEYETIDGKLANYLWNQMRKNDSENLIPTDLINWTEKIPFWHNRITNIKLDYNAESIANSTLKKLLNETKKCRLYNRINLKNMLLYKELVY